jgi:hypothetical protein
MKLSVLAAGPEDSEAGTAAVQDALERYRSDVERKLVDDHIFPEEEARERFFGHIIESFFREVSPAECARLWLGSCS